MEGKRPRCWVCGFETSIRKGLKVTVKGCTDARCKKNMVQCSDPTCDIIAHSHMDGENKRFIFDIPCFVVKTCFDIAHDDRFRGMFVENNSAESRQKRTAQRGHRLYEQIRMEYTKIIEKRTSSKQVCQDGEESEQSSDIENRIQLNQSSKKTNRSDLMTNDQHLQSSETTASGTPKRQVLTNIQIKR